MIFIEFRVLNFKKVRINFLKMKSQQSRKIKLAQMEDQTIVNLVSMVGFEK
jgi:hypothetical protein